jgi:aryl-phospho-beta-D-glucosidase BglC (GH1 family)
MSHSSSDSKRRSQSDTLRRAITVALNRALLATGALVALANAPSAFAQTAACEVTYTKAWEGGTGFGANLVITNNGPAITNGWTLQFDFPSGQRVQNGWPVSFTQASGSATVNVASNAAWNASIASGGSLSAGFNGSFTTANTAPTRFVLNGTVCNGDDPGSDNQAPTISLTSPTSGQNFASGATVTLSASASDTDGSIARVEFVVDGNVVSTDTSAPYSYNAAGLADGSHTVKATAYDNGSPALSASAEGSFSIGSTSGGDTVFRVNQNGRITKNGDVLPVRCGNWFGLEGRHEPSNDATNPGGAPMELYVGNVFWANGGAGTGRTIQQTMSEITAKGINMIRLPVVPQTLNANDSQGTGSVLKNHQSVRQTNARAALEEFIKLADQNNIEVLLDIHSCSNYVGWRKGRLDARPPWTDATRENYDFTREEYSCSSSGNPSSVTTVHAYDQSKWLDNLRTLAGLGEQLGVDNIVGIDIFNEPWDYTWAEWKTLAESAYQAINEVNPNTLVFVEGISASAGNQDGSPSTITQVPHGDVATNPNWGENLYEAGANPINIPKERVVFSPHTYGPSVFVQKMFMDPAQPQCTGLEGDAAGDANCNIVIDSSKLRPGWEEHFGYLKDLGYAVVVGEFGGNLDWPLGQTSLRDRERWSHITPGVDQQWQSAFIDYMTDKGIEGCYWSINPESGDTAGWYGHAYDPISNTGGWGTWLDFDSRKTNLLNTLWGR